MEGYAGQLGEATSIPCVIGRPNATRPPRFRRQLPPSAALRLCLSAIPPPPSTLRGLCAFASPPSRRHLLPSASPRLCVSAFPASPTSPQRRGLCRSEFVSAPNPRPFRPFPIPANPFHTSTPHFSMSSRTPPPRLNFPSQSQTRSRTQSSQFLRPTTHKQPNSTTKITDLESRITTHQD